MAARTQEMGGGGGDDRREGWWGGAGPGRQEGYGLEPNKVGSRCEHIGAEGAWGCEQQRDPGLGEGEDLCAVGAAS